jgi:hypothetical protein
MLLGLLPISATHRSGAFHPELAVMAEMVCSAATAASNMACALTTEERRAGQPPGCHPVRGWSRRAAVSDQNKTEPHSHTP